jgi:hypothetical protein
MKIRPVGAELFHSDRQTDRQTDMTKPRVSFHYFSNAPKKSFATYHLICIFALSFVLYAPCQFLIWTIDVGSAVVNTLAS